VSWKETDGEDKIVLVSEKWFFDLGFRPPADGSISDLL